jgi:protein TonB
VRVRGPNRDDGRSKLAGGIGSVLVHAAAVLFLVSQVGKSTSSAQQVYAVDLVARPAATPKKRLATEATPRPPVEKPAPVKPKPTPPPKTPPKPEPKPPAPTEPDREAPPPTATETPPVEGATPSTGTDAATIKTPGLDFPYPEYLRNIVNQIYERWEREDDPRPRTAEISFLIRRDGSVHDIRFVNRSGSFAFDLGAQGAVEAAGNSLAFGPLPDGWEADVLPVSLNFKPVE